MSKKLALLKIKNRITVTLTVFEGSTEDDNFFHFCLKDANRKQIFNPEQELLTLGLLEQAIQRAKYSARLRQKLFQVT